MKPSDPQPRGETDLSLGSKEQFAYAKKGDDPLPVTDVEAVALTAAPGAPIYVYFATITPQAPGVSVGKVHLSMPLMRPYDGVGSVTPQAGGLI